ncbi:MAG: ABC transporter substrate-binding protein [Candidatus Hydrogenedentes bacterium]|nr:ABC transporter substrate-binding protein [Candidatus Hydrogenedentota bacterium]
MSAALSGPAADLGIEMSLGVRTAFDELNRAGGVQGRPLQLIALDDGYEPERAVPNMHRLIEQDNVLALVGNVGTPTAVAAVPIANRAGVPFFGAFTGAGGGGGAPPARGGVDYPARDAPPTPPDRVVVNYRASYAEETEAMVDALVEVVGVRPAEIAFFTQRDAYGDAGFAGGARALKRHGLEDPLNVAHGRYERNTLAVENGLADLLLHDTLPKAVIMVGAYAPCAEFIKLARTSGLNGFFLNVSFTGAEPLRLALGEAGEGVIITQVVPHFESALPAVEAYRKALSSLDPEAAPSFGSLEGYIAARILCRALESVSGPIGRDAIIESLESLGTFDIGLGTPLELGPDKHQACHQVWPTVIRGGRVVPMEWSDLASRSGE